MKKIISKVFLGIFSLALVVSSIALDEKLKALSYKAPEPEVAQLQDGQAIALSRIGGFYELSGGADGSVFILGGNAVLRFSQGSSATLAFIPSDSGERKAEIEFSKGRIWGNTEASSLSLRVSAGSVLFEAQPGVFDVAYLASEITAKAFRNELWLSVAGNPLVIPQNRQMKLSEAKILGNTETLAKLHYSKLTKEFPYAPLAGNDEWGKKNTKEDAAFFAEYRKKIEEEIRSTGPKMSGDEEAFLNRMNRFFKKGSLFLTFDSARKQAKEIEQMLDFVDSASYAILVSNSELAQKYLFSFQAFSREMGQDLSASVSARSRISQAFDRFSFALPNDGFFEVKRTLRQILDRTQLQKIHDELRDVIMLAASGSDDENAQRTLVAIRRFGSQVNSNVKKISGPQAAQDLFFTSVLFNEFLGENPRFLREEFFKVSELLESGSLSLVADAAAAEDLRQYFLSEKLRFISFLKDLLEKGDLPFQDGRRSILLLANQVEALRPNFSDAAVVEYFEEQMAAVRPLLAFLRSSSADNLHGSFDESMEEFEERQEEFREVKELLGEASGGEAISASRREELAALISSDVGGIGVSDIKVTLPTSEDDARVKIVSGKLEGISFTAVYDTARKVFTDLVIADEKFPNAVRLENLQKLFLIRSGKLTPGTGETVDALSEQPSETSLLEKVSKTKLLDELTKLGINVEEKYLGFENFTDDIIHVRLGLIGEGAEARVFSFDVSQKGSVISNLKVQTVSGEVSVNDTFGLRELPVKVEQIYQRALFEKQKEEELEEFLEEGTVEELDTEIGEF